jgi:hypothetical protein
MIPERTAAIVLGMHRSGTSALAGAAVRLGFAQPLTPLAPSADNPGGFYESTPVVLTNHYILEAEGCGWNTCLGFEPARAGSRLSASDRRFMLNTLRREFGNAAAFVLKDPRLCLTLPAWLPTLRELGAEPLAFIVVRHPSEVIMSLETRNELTAEDMAPLWLHHMLEADHGSRGLRRAFVSYDALLEDWEHCLNAAARSVDLAWPTPLDEGRGEVAAFLSAPLRHHKAATPTAAIGPAPVAEMVNVAWMAFTHLTEEPASQDALNCLDRVRERFAQWRRPH